MSTRQLSSIFVLALLSTSLILLSGCTDKTVNTKKTHVSKEFGISFEYPSKFIIGRYANPGLSAEMQAQLLASGLDIPFKNTIVLIEQSELGNKDVKSIPVGEVAAIMLDFSTGARARFLEETFCKDPIKKEIGKNTVYKLPGYPGPSGEGSFYYLIRLPNGILELMAHKRYLKSVRTSTQEGRELPPTHYDKDIETIIANLVSLK